VEGDLFGVKAVLPSGLVITVLALVTATILLLVVLAALERRVWRARDRWEDTKARLFFSARHAHAGVTLSFIVFALFLAASLLAATGRAADVLMLLSLFMFVVVSWAGLLTALCVHLTLKQPEPDDVLPGDLATASGDPAQQWPPEPAFAYPHSRPDRIAWRPGPRCSLSMTGDGIYVFAGHRPRRFVPWTEVASVSEAWIDDGRHFLAPRDVTIHLRDGTGLLLAAGLGSRRRAHAVLLIHARRLGIPLRAIDRRARTLATAKRMRSPEAFRELRRSGVVTEITEFWQERLVYDRRDGAPRA
jgi:hypothetical protein